MVTIYSERDRRFRGVRTVYHSPCDWEIGFVSSSFSFHACLAYRVCGRGEAAWGGVGEHGILEAPGDFGLSTV